MKTLLLIAVSIILLSAAVPAEASFGKVTDVNMRIAPVGGYGQAVAAATHNSNPWDAPNDLYTVFGFDSFLDDDGYALRVGAIRASDWTGTVADWDNGVYAHVEWTSGTAGRVYPVIEGIELDGGDDEISISDVLNGVPPAVDIPDLIDTGKLSLINIYLENFSAGSQLKRGYYGTPTTVQVWDETGYENAYLIAQVMDLNLTGQPITVDAWVAPIPEPATMALLALGGLALLRRRRRRV